MKNICPFPHLGLSEMVVILIQEHWVISKFNKSSLFNDVLDSFRYVFSLIMPLSSCFFSHNYFKICKEMYFVP